jgi:hypothetical protein
MIGAEETGLSVRGEPASLDSDGPQFDYLTRFEQQAKPIDNFINSTGGECSHTANLPPVSGIW